MVWVLLLSMAMPNGGVAIEKFRGGPALRDSSAAWLRWILGSITPPISPRLPA
jgi:hypothetical protein